MGELRRRCKLLHVVTLNELQSSFIVSYLNLNEKLVTVKVSGEYIFSLFSLHLCISVFHKLSTELLLGKALRCFTLSA